MKKTFSLTTASSAFFWGGGGVGASKKAKFNNSQKKCKFESFYFSFKEELGVYWNITFSGTR